MLAPAATPLPPGIIASPLGAGQEMPKVRLEQHGGIVSLGQLCYVLPVATMVFQTSSWK